MQQSLIIDWLALIAVCLATACLVAAFLTGRARAVRPAPVTADTTGDGDPVFLFEQGELIDATEGGSALLDGHKSGSSWTALANVLAPRYPGFPPDWQSAQGQGAARYRPADPSDDSEALLETVDDRLRLHLRPFRRGGGVDQKIDHDAADLHQQVNALQVAANAAPFPAWQRLDSGAVGWHNAAYASLYLSLHGGPPVPKRPIIQTLLDGRSKAGTVRSSITVHGSGQTLWFDVTVVRHDGFSMFYAQDVNAVVRAEVAQRNFVQTLAKTFGQLAIGLAIFDRDQRLVLFNPALLDLTTLPADFLSVRPDLASFFDRLRDSRMMPEPKNYGSWREQMADLVAAAADGRYQETWSLPSGSTYQVSGRPHPDGAIAFLFEDITAEVTLTRRFRADIELGQSILDTLEDAIAVFSTAGVLVFSNRAYGALWGVDPDHSFADVTIRDAVRDWQSNSRGAGIWNTILETVCDPGDRTPKKFHVPAGSDGEMACCIDPIQGGATMVAFRKFGGPVGHEDARELLSEQN